MTRKTSLHMIAVLVSLFTTAQAAIAQSPSQPALTKVPLEIKKLTYKELKDGKHQIVVNWGVDGGGGITLTKLIIDLELTDAKGFKQKVTRTLTSQSAGSGSVSITPIPIPKDPLVGVPITDLFRGNIDPKDPIASVLKFKVTLTATALSPQGGTSERRPITGIGQKEGTLKIICTGGGCE